MPIRFCISDRCYGKEQVVARKVDCLEGEPSIANEWVETNVAPRSCLWKQPPAVFRQSRCCERHNSSIKRNCHVREGLPIEMVRPTASHKVFFFLSGFKWVLSLLDIFFIIFLRGPNHMQDDHDCSPGADSHLPIRPIPPRSQPNFPEVLHARESKRRVRLLDPDLDVVGALGLPVEKSPTRLVKGCPRTLKVPLK